MRLLIYTSTDVACDDPPLYAFDAASITHAASMRSARDDWAVWLEGDGHLLDREGHSLRERDSACLRRGDVLVVW